MCWKIYRHKNNPEIRYWVLTYIEHPDPRVYTTLEGGRYARIKGVRNVRFDTEDRPFTLAPEAGLWPMEKFLELYEPEEAA